MNQNELKPCPFCGSEAMLKSFDDFRVTKYFIQCLNYQDCGGRILSRFTEKEAVAAWNTRYEPPNEPLTFDELKQMDGEPVWITATNKLNGMWATVRTCNGFYDVATGYGTVRPLEYYGETFIAYRTKPKEDKP